MSLNWTKIFLLLAVMCIALFGDHWRGASYSMSAAPIAPRTINVAAPLLILTSPTVGSASGAMSTALDNTSVSRVPLEQTDTGAISQNAPLPVVRPTPRVGTISGDNATLTASTGFGGGFYKVAQNPIPLTGARIVYVADFGNTTFLSQNAGARWPLASLTKLMTAVVIIDSGGLTDVVHVQDAAANLDDTRGILQAGDTYSANDLLRIMLTYSSNAAAETLAAHYGRDSFITAMNAKAIAWGMMDTNYSDPSGLSSANQSTAHDLVLLASHILGDYRQIFAITRTPQISVTELNTRRVLHVKNINEFAGRADFVGGKTGYTDDANGNLLSVFRYHYHLVILIVLGTANNDRFADTSTLLSWFEQNYR